MPKQQQFTCPACGSHKFGSSENADGTLERLCHGDFYDTDGNYCSCHFTWHQNDDHLYFVDTIYDAPEGPFVGMCR